MSASTQGRGRPARLSVGSVPNATLDGERIVGPSEPTDVSSVRASGLPPPPRLGTLRDPSTGSRDGASSSRPIGIQARKSEEVSRPGAGGSKMTFVPKMPPRRKKEAEDMKPEVPTIAARGTGDRGRGRGRGVGRGHAEMTASGPFALGPSALSLNRRPTRGLSSLTSHGGGGPSGSGSSTTDAPKRSGMVQADTEQYSDTEEGVEIVDLDEVGNMDEMAPLSLKRMKLVRPNAKKKVKELEKSPGPLGEKGKAKAEPEDDSTASLHSSVRPTAEPEDNNGVAANALNLSESEEEEEMEDMLDDFLYNGDATDEFDPTRERFYFFQFPSPFPTFTSNTPVAPIELDMEPAEHPPNGETEALTKGKKAVSFAGDVKGETKDKKPAIKPDPGKGPPPKVDGVIGRMELYRGGMIKLVMGDNIAMEVHPGAETAFLENVVHLDPVHKQMTQLGAVERRFVVSPDVDALLAEIEVDDKLHKENVQPKYEGLIKME